MERSAQHKFTKWIFNIFQPVTNYHSKYRLEDSFELANFMQNYKIANRFMCSYDISNLFTCALINTIDICTDFLYRSQKSPPYIPENIFIELMKFATTSVEFSFNDIMYREIDGAAMGSVPYPIMAKTFVGFYEKQLLSGPSHTKKR